MAVGPEAGCEFVGLMAGIRTHPDVTHTSGQVPARMHDATRFRIAGVLVERGNQLVGELKPLQLAVDIPGTVSPLHVDTITGGRQIFWFCLARKEVFIMPV